MKNFEQNASDSRPSKHIYLRGNHNQDMFHDKVDKINAWNRLWLSAKATDTQILSVEILDNHLHCTARFESEDKDSRFMHHFRLSLTQYYNRRYEVKGMLGTRRFGRATLKDDDDLKDCICYHIRNVVHHGITNNYLDYQFSTVRFVFRLATKAQSGVYTSKTLPSNLALAYLPRRKELPKGWEMTKDGMIVPHSEVFQKDIVESLFNNSRTEYLDTLTQRTNREFSDHDEPWTSASHSRPVQTFDEIVSKYVNNKLLIPIPAMTPQQKILAIMKVRKRFPKVPYKTLSRIFAMPRATIYYQLKKLNTREQS